jgi:hypothetical protein
MNILLKKLQVKTINLNKFKPTSVPIFTGRPQGELVRNELNLDECDNDKNCFIKFIIPGDIISLNPSFYLGLFFKSYKKLNVEGFGKKYTFEIDTNDEDILRVILKDLEDGNRNAINSLLNPNSSFNSFFN